MWNFWGYNAMQSFNYRGNWGGFSQHTWNLKAAQRKKNKKSKTIYWYLHPWIWKSNAVLQCIGWSWVSCPLCGNAAACNFTECSVHLFWGPCPSTTTRWIEVKKTFILKWCEYFFREWWIISLKLQKIGDNYVAQSQDDYFSPNLIEWCLVDPM